MPKTKTSWRQRDGSLISIDKMTDNHLANAIRMVVRQWNVKGKRPTSTNFEMLYAEAKKREFKFRFSQEPLTLNGKTEYVDIYIPGPQSKVLAGFFPSELDSREDV